MCVCVCVCVYVCNEYFIDLSLTKYVLIHSLSCLQSNAIGLLMRFNAMFTLSKTKTHAVVESIIKLNFSHLQCQEKSYNTGASTWIELQWGKHYL